jgi:hypothetical protein
MKLENKIKVVEIKGGGAYGTISVRNKFLGLIPYWSQVGTSISTKTSPQKAVMTVVNRLQAHTPDDWYSKQLYSKTLFGKHKFVGYYFKP